MYYIIVFLPLLGFLIAAIGGKTLAPRASELITSSFMVIVAGLSWIVFLSIIFGNDSTVDIPLLQWITIGKLAFNWSLHIDTLTAVMLVVVNSVSALVHIYSIGYMHHDPSRPRFFAYLSLFTFMMLMLVTANNLIQMFFGWEGVGLVSYLLIGFWFQRASANKAAMKAFVVNRVGDFGFLLGIFNIFVLFQSVNFVDIFTKAADNNFIKGMTFLEGYFGGQTVITITCLLLFVGAMGKSAQFLLHTWLPDAMEGPTPVSALIHAATMVTAGVFMIARMSPIFELSPNALTVIIIIGATTAFFAATVGLVQNDIKRVIAYSTCSQLGYMFVGLGVGAYGAAIFHLFTHAFFKALLFLGAGSVIHAVSDEQDMRKMGGLYKHIKTTYWMMFIGTIALTGFGIPGTLFGAAGFFSKDAIIESAFASHNIASEYAFWLLVVSALLTSFYSWRLVFMTFHGKTRATVDVMHHVHESASVMLVPLFVLSIGALFSGVIFQPYFLGDFYDSFWKGALFTGSHNHILHELHNVPNWVKWSPFTAMILGSILAYLFYILVPSIPKKIAEFLPILYRFLYNKWYFDEIYNVLFVRSALGIGNFFWKVGDNKIIDGLGPNGIAARIIDITNKVVRIQTGYLYHYAFTMLIGVAALITWMMIGSLN
ncbi:NADH dehydrogenase I chain L [Bartonella clarridgeiae 73]|uniref:NADH-ubiquinone oxidoreductase chain 5 n=1 Tax=Bartonella clarridgeiae (strain CCUG 45776 / CIP 104772 / 73) TaxID=696125 RepID=E6YHS0_BARC7|nr:NADH-quinone oxidoreductase subunit L [Bartonella clarridgeiae]WCR55017.1 MAG: NADH-ubiquinone oxidoreductase chain L [Bartonella clarridgeiae]CBI76408.1 NADH dehydrogenase I chain L [Bartonella clarridgeiae 73]